MQTKKCLSLWVTHLLILTNYCHLGKHTYCYLISHLTLFLFIFKRNQKFLFSWDIFFFLNVSNSFNNLSSIVNQRKLTGLIKPKAHSLWPLVKKFSLPKRENADTCLSVSWVTGELDLSSCLFYWFAYNIRKLVLEAMLFVTFQYS